MVERVHPPRAHFVGEHIGIIVSKTGHDRGQKEMFLYSPTIVHEGGRVVCSQDFMKFEVGQWIRFRGTNIDAYGGGEAYRDCQVTNQKFDKSVLEARASVYPDEITVNGHKTSYTSCKSRDRVRCWSPDVGSCFVESTLYNQLKMACSSSDCLANVVLVWSPNVAVFHDGEEDEYVYWKVSEVKDQCPLEDQTNDYVLAPWRQEVVDLRGQPTVDPWLILSPRVLSNEMFMRWHEKEMLKDEKDRDVNKVSEAETRRNEEILVIARKMEAMGHNDKRKNLWKKILSHDGRMLEPGEPLPRVSYNMPSRGDQPIVYDSAGLFMAPAAAESYVDKKKDGEDRFWRTGSWKKDGTVWDADAASERLKQYKIEINTPREKAEEDVLCQMTECPSSHKLSNEGMRMDCDTNEIRLPSAPLQVSDLSTIVPRLQPAPSVLKTQVCRTLIQEVPTPTNANNEDMKDDNLVRQLHSIPKLMDRNIERPPLLVQEMQYGNCPSPPLPSEIPSPTFGCGSSIASSARPSLNWQVFKKRNVRVPSAGSFSFSSPSPVPKKAEVEAVNDRSESTHLETAAEVHSEQKKTLSKEEHKKKMENSAELLALAMDLDDGSGVVPEELIKKARAMMQTKREEEEKREEERREMERLEEMKKEMERMEEERMEAERREAERREMERIENERKMMEEEERRREEERMEEMRKAEAKEKRKMELMMQIQKEEEEELLALENKEKEVIHMKNDDVIRPVPQQQFSLPSQKSNYAMSLHVMNEKKEELQLNSIVKENLNEAMKKNGLIEVVSHPTNIITLPTPSRPFLVESTPCPPFQSSFFQKNPLIQEVVQVNTRDEDNNLKEESDIVQKDEMSVDVKSHREEWMNGVIEKKTPQTPPFSPHEDMSAYGRSSPSDLSRSMSRFGRLSSRAMGEDGVYTNHVNNQVDSCDDSVIEGKERQLEEMVELEREEEITEDNSEFELASLATSNESRDGKKEERKECIEESTIALITLDDDDVFTDSEKEEEVGMKEEGKGLNDTHESIESGPSVICDGDSIDQTVNEKIDMGDIVIVKKEKKDEIRVKKRSERGSTAGYSSDEWSDWEDRHVADERDCAFDFNPSTFSSYQSSFASAAILEMQTGRRELVTVVNDKEEEKDKGGEDIEEEERELNEEMDTVPENVEVEWKEENMEKVEEDEEDAEVEKEKEEEAVGVDVKEDEEVKLEMVNMENVEEDAAAMVEVEWNEDVEEEKGMEKENEEEVKEDEEEQKNMEKEKEDYVRAVMENEEVCIEENEKGNEDDESVEIEERIEEAVEKESEVTVMDSYLQQEQIVEVLQDEEIAWTSEEVVIDEVEGDETEEIEGQVEDDKDESETITEDNMDSLMSSVLDDMHMAPLPPSPNPSLDVATHKYTPLFSELRETIRSIKMHDIQEAANVFGERSQEEDERDWIEKEGVTAEERVAALAEDIALEEEWLGYYELNGDEEEVQGTKRNILLLNYERKSIEEAIEKGTLKRDSLVETFDKKERNELSAMLKKMQKKVTKIWDKDVQKTMENVEEKKEEMEKNEWKPEPALMIDYRPIVDHASHVYLKGPALMNLNKEVGEEKEEEERMDTLKIPSIAQRIAIDKPKLAVKAQRECGMITDGRGDCAGESK